MKTPLFCVTRVSPRHTLLHRIPDILDTEETMRFFYVALGEQRWLDDIFALVKQYDDMLSKLRGVRVGILVRFAKWRRACLPCKLAEKYDVPLFVDNGAFEYLTRSDLERAEIPWSTLERWIEEYSSWMAAWYNYVTAAALPDIPVHGRDFLPPSIRATRIHLTARLHARFLQLMKRYPEVLGRMIIVVQGFTVEEYQGSLHLNAHLEGAAETCTIAGGCPYRGVVGVGSVCVRKQSAKGKTGTLANGKAAGTLNEFLREFLDASWPEWLRGFHFFGLHTDAVRAYAEHPRYFASDTGAHGLNFRYKWRTRLKCRELDKECYLKAIENQIRTTLAPLLNPRLDAFAVYEG